MTVTTQGPNGETVATVDEVAALKYSTASQKTPDEMAAIGMRMMISNSFAPKTRLRMASRLLIMEVSARSLCIIYSTKLPWRTNLKFL